MSTQIVQILSRLKKPSVTLSIVSQIISIFILMGYNINENKIMAIMTIACSILVTLGIMSNPDTQKKGYGDDLKVCSATGQLEPHVMVNGQLVCASCGAVSNEQPVATAVAAQGSATVSGIAENTAGHPE